MSDERDYVMVADPVADPVADMAGVERLTVWASPSSIGKHRSCPQAWYYRHRLGLQVLGDEIAPERDFGSWWHAVRAADAITRGREARSLRCWPDEITTVDGGPTFPAQMLVDEFPEGEYPGMWVTTATILVGAQEWWEKKPTEYQDEFVSRIGEDLPTRLDVLFKRWQTRWAAEIAREQPVAVEARWERTLPRPADMSEANAAIAPDVNLVGYVDEVYFDTRRRILVVRDHKTGKTLSTQTAQDDLLDSQNQLYAWGISPQVKSWGFGPVKATAYDRVRTVRPRTPVLTLSGTLSKTVTDFDLATYLEWVDNGGEGQHFDGRKKDLSDAGVYQAEQSVIERLSTPAEGTRWFQRTLVPLNLNVVRTHLRAAVDSGIDIGRTIERTDRTHEAQRNLAGSACRWCDFAALCRAQMIGGPDGDYDLAALGLRDGRKKGR